ncbi:hypothetical protein PhCBS80983_g05631 [Powellomyces hirtus]|uniref:Uncharacterized protein n=1 Tax=Powellomyces hirtus TaxID=109895 RepID=A0A507DUA8_9FUNG|nr:hypothetical protein PhCBS80983_g05631 [Powellomyces hirtus]
MNGRQSFLLNDIKTTIRNGGNVTHILNVKISNEGPNKIGTRVRQRVFQLIKDKQLIQQVNDIPIAVTWKSSAKLSSAYYHSNNPMFTDMVIKRHTKLLLEYIIREIDGEFNNVFSTGTTGLAFMVTKPLTREVAVDDYEDVRLSDLSTEPRGDEDEIDETDEQV